MDRDQVKRAYELLGVSETATSHAIRQAYRAMAKRWHPDLYPAGTAEQVEAQKMMALVNEAYSRIQRAPLRYISNSPRASSTPESKPPIMSEREPFIRMDRFEFWVRFVCGAIFGFLVSAGLAVRVNLFFEEIPTTLLVCVAIAVILACGFGAARSGDRFWYAVFGIDR